MNFIELTNFFGGTQSNIDRGKESLYFMIDWLQSEALVFLHFVFNACFRVSDKSQTVLNLCTWSDGALYLYQVS